MAVNPRGIRSPIPAGNLIGRGRGKGTGAASLVSVASLAQQIMTNGVIAPPGSASPLQPIADGDILANIAGSSAAPIANTATSVLDHVFSSTQGTLLYRDSAVWKALATGTSGKSLLTGGAAANPSWSYPDAGTLLGTTLNATVVTSSLTSVGTLVGLTITPPTGTDGLDITSISVTGSASDDGLSIDGTWNTSGNPSAIFVNMTNTASGVNAALLRLQVAGTDSFVIGAPGGTASVLVSGTNTSANTSAVNIVNLNTFFNPGGASLTNIRGVNISPNITGSSITISNYEGLFIQTNTAAGFTGTVTAGYGILLQTPTINGSHPFTGYTGIRQVGITNGGGNTAGTITNIGLEVDAFTATAGSGGTMVNEAVLVAMPSGVNAGTTTNYGLRITGNGQTGGATNWAINSTSTAASQITGGLNSTPIGAGTASTGAFTTLTASGATTLTAGTASTTTGTGTLVVTGGIGCSGAHYIGGTLGVPGTTTALFTSTATFTSGAAGNTGTLTNAPAAGNPTTWIKINDNGVTRFIPAW